jgi:hypothetical protein
MSRRPAVLLAITVFLAACGAGGDGPDPDLDTPLLQIRYEGGFAPADFALTQGPTYTLTRDGILISPAAVPAIFPGPLVTPYMSSQVTPGELDQLQDMIEAIGLPAMVDEYDNDAIDFVADAHTTVVTYWDSEGAHAYSVYALGIAEPRREATRALQQMVTVLETIAGRSAAEWLAEQVQLVAIPGAIDPEFGEEREWPLGESVDTWAELAGMRCAVMDASVLDEFTDANQATTFPSPDPQWAAVFRLAVRPLHPGEAGCELPGN